jgi:hypothetical protein
MRVAAIMLASFLVGSCVGAEPREMASLDLVTPSSVEARQALGSAVLKDLSNRRLQQLIRQRVPDASPSSLDDLTLGLVTETKELGGAVSRMSLECSFHNNHDATADDRRLLHACVEEVRAALNRASRHGTLP